MPSGYGQHCSQEHSELPKIFLLPMLCWLITFHDDILFLYTMHLCVSQNEELRIVAGILKFHNYWYGRHFEIYTDHKTLLGLFMDRNATPLILSP
ncbi:hypothetical protein PR048_024677 [Dryococelus australis]|uniref:Reverse transcriptase RNase H-like domain-containing protein n=1 Tax=Dryococelus australis TaxID=614101 RepID=A0ABQ9GP79_9NEOP|nr:hypothetical protein PR048_024677 [Dryococelus australis]